MSDIADTCEKVVQPRDSGRRFANEDASRQGGSP